MTEAAPLENKLTVAGAANNANFVYIRVLPNV